MGMYTEVFFRGSIREDAPEVVIDAIQSIVHGGGERPDIDHPLFDCTRWDSLGTCSSAYFPTPAKSAIKQDAYNGTMALILHANLKNYDDEIEKFFDWIDPYVDARPGEFLGYSLYEEVDPDSAPTPYFKKEN